MQHWVNIVVLAELEKNHEMKGNSWKEYQTLEIEKKVDQVPVMFFVLCSTLLVSVTAMSSLWLSFSQGFQVHPLYLLFHSARISQSGWFFCF